MLHPKASAKTSSQFPTSIQLHPPRAPDHNMISFATIGTSWITDSFISSAHSTGQWQLSAVYSRDDAKGKDFALKYDDKNVHIHTSLAALVSDDKVDAVYIASPNSLHFEHAKACIEARKHVIVEKPAACNSCEFDELCRLSREHSVFFLEAFRHIHEASFDLLRQALHRLGSIYGASFTYASYSSRYNNVLAGETPNIFSLDFAGGSLVDLGVYPISAAIALFGKPNAQSYAPVTIRTGADGGGVVVLKYDDFAVQINASKIYTSNW